ncbi:MAG: T9SS type A sorting domain-containing protein [Bacteroidetes bacterium]|nr:T9SS type A sorting domain-containing protein [Bacteroidota bacterium]
MKRLLIIRSVWLLLALNFTLPNVGNAQQITAICPVFQTTYATGSCSNSAKTQTSLIKAYSGYGERGWAKFDISSLPASVTIIDVKIHYYIDNQNYPYYHITKLPVDPVTASAQNIFYQIGLDTSASPTNPLTYYSYTGSPVSGWNTGTLNTFARTDLQSSLQANWFAVGFFEYEDVSSYYLNAHGWNETNKPYLEVNYINGPLLNDIALSGFVSPPQFACADTMPVKVVVYNNGTNIINSATLYWTLNSVTMPAVAYSKPGGLLPGTHDTVVLGMVYFSPGYYSLNAGASLPNGGQDVNTGNNYASRTGTIIGIPLITTQPANQNVAVGAYASFYIVDNQSYYSYYHWQLSTDNGLTFTNLVNNTTYHNVDSSNMYIHNVQLSMNGYLFRCVIENTCGTVISNAAMLTVSQTSLLISHIYADPDTICQSQSTTLYVLATGGSGMYTYTWTSDPAGFTSTLQNPAVSPTQTTHYFCTVNDGINTLTASCWVYMLNLPEPAGIITGPSSVCKGQYNVVYSVPPIPNATYYYWTLPTGITGTTNSANIAVTIGTNAVSGNIIVRGHNSCGLGLSSTKPVTVNPSPIINAGPDQTIYQGGSATITASATAGSPPYSFVWSNGATGASITVSPTTTTTYVVTVTGSNGCTGIDYMVVNVTPATNIITSIPPQYSCPGALLIPVNVNNFYGVASISLSLHYDTTHLVYTGYQGVNSQLSSGTWLINQFQNVIQVAWFSLTPANIGNGTLFTLKFNATVDSSILSWDLVTQGACMYTNLNNITIPAIFNDGHVDVHMCSNVEGYVYYKNNLESPMTATPVTLLQSGSPVYQTLTDSTGHFIFTNLNNGNYHLVANPTKPWSSVNAADALMVLRHFVGILTLTGITLQAGDVDLSGAVNSADALLIARRFVNMIQSFAAGNWVSENHTVTVNGDANIVDSIAVLCTGDVDRSYIPAIAKTGDCIRIIPSGSLPVKPGETISIPFIAETDAEIGSVSLVMDFRSDYLIVKDISPSQEGFQVFTANDQQIRFAWYSLTPMRIHAGEELFHLVCTVTNARGNLYTEAGNEFEITDNDGIKLNDFRLTYPIPVISDERDLLRQNTPNPFSIFTDISYTLEREGNVQLALFDHSGRKVQQLIDNQQDKGVHTFRLSRQALSPGLYIYQIQVTSSNGIYTDTKKLIIE